MKAFIFDPLWNSLATKELVDRLHRVDLDFQVTTEIAPLGDCHALFDGSDERILCLSPDYVDWRLTAADYQQIPNLTAILIAATSFSWVDTAYADNHGIAVCNIRNFSTQAVAEWAIAVMFSLARRIPLLIKDGFPLNYGTDFLKYRGVEIKGKTAGIVGMGNIGSSIAERCAALGMTVTYWSRKTRNDAYGYVDLTQLMAESDVIFLTLPSNEETSALLTSDLLTGMRRTAMFITIAHKLFDEEIVLDMVENDRLFGFGFQADPETFDRYSGNIWAAPPYAWDTDAAMHNSVSQWIENMCLATRRKFPTRIN